MADLSHEWITEISSMQKNIGYQKSRDHIAAFIDEYGEDSDILNGREGFVHAVGFQLAKQEPHDRAYNEELKRQRKHKIFNEDGEVASKQRFTRQAVGKVRGRQTVHGHKSHHSNHHKKGHCHDHDNFAGFVARYGKYDFFGCRADNKQLQQEGNHKPQNKLREYGYKRYVSDQSVRDQIVGGHHDDHPHTHHHTEIEIFFLSCWHFHHPF